MLNLGDFTTSDTLYVPLTTYDGDGGSVTLTGLAVTDIEIYKDGSTTQRASDNGYTLLDTDGIDFDSTTGLHGFSVDLSDNSDAGFYANGSQFWVVVNAVTVDGQTVVVAYYFTIGRLLKPTTAGRTLGVESDGDLTKVNTLDGHTAQTGDSFARLGAAGAGLTAVPWNAAWDAEVQSECTDALNAYDPPTKAEMDAVHATTDALITTVDGVADAILVDTAEIGAAGAGLAAVPWNAAWDAEVQSEVQDAIEANKLDHLVAVADGDDPVNDSIMAKMAASDGDWSGFDKATESLEAIRDRGDAAWASGAENPNVLVSTTVASVTSQTEFTLTAGPDFDGALKDQAIVLYDKSNSDYPSVRKCTSYTGATQTVVLDSAPDFTFVNGDDVKSFVTAPGTTAPTVDEIATAWIGKTNTETDRTKLGGQLYDTHALAGGNKVEKDHDAADEDVKYYKTDDSTLLLTRRRTVTGAVETESIV